MRGADDFNPLAGRELVARKNEANPVIENFCRGAGQGAQAVIAQHAEIVAQTHTGEFDAINNLHGRKGVNVHLRNGMLHRAQNVAVIKGIQPTRQPALNTHFACTQFPCLHGLFGDLQWIKKVRV